MVLTHLLILMKIISVCVAAPVNRASGIVLMKNALRPAVYTAAVITTLSISRDMDSVGIVGT